MAITRQTPGKSLGSERNSREAEAISADYTCTIAEGYSGLLSHLLVQATDRKLKLKRFTDSLCF